MADILDDLEAELDALATPAPVDPLDEIFEEGAAPKQDWKPVCNVALIYQQRCRACSHEHSFFQGWFVEKRYAKDRHTRKLVSGKAPDLPAIVERQNHGLVDWCSDCIEAQIIIDNAALKGK